MEKCQHGDKIIHFCIYEYCSAKQAAGCENCLKKYHSHVGQTQFIKTEDVDFLAQKFNVQNSVKPKCRQFQESVFSFFTQVKTEISQTIDLICKGMVNKVGYPLLSSLNHLSSYKRIKNKEYKKLMPKELRKIYLDCKNLDIGSISLRERQLYIEEIVQNFGAIETMEKLMKEYENLAKKFCKNFKHDSSSFIKIQDLRKYLNTILKIDRKEVNRLVDNKDSKKSLSLQNTGPSDLKNVINQQNTLSQEKQKPNIKIHQFEQVFSSKNVPQQNERSQKFKNVRNFSIEKELKMKEFNGEYEIKIIGHQSSSYQSNEKEILQRKEKLMKMMSLKEKSLGKLLDNNSSIKNHESSLISPPLLQYQKNLNETSNEKQKKSEQVLQFLFMQKSAQNQLKIQTPEKKQQGTHNFPVSPNTIQNQNSVKSFRQKLQIQSRKNVVTHEEESEDEKEYKYGMSKLPSFQSNSSEIEKSLGLEDAGQIKSKKNRMSQSSPVSLKIERNVSRKIEDSIQDEEKSVGLYLIAVEQGNSMECIRYLKAALSYCPMNISAAEHLSSIYINQNLAKDCLDLCNEYLTLMKKLNKSQLKLHFLINKSASLNSLGRYSESITLLQSEVLHYENAKMYKNLADAYFSIGINEKCQYNYEKAIRLNPKFDQAMYNLAVIIFAQGNFFNADIWISKALEIDQKNGDYLTLKRENVKRLENVRQENKELD